VNFKTVVKCLYSSSVLQIVDPLHSRFEPPYPEVPVVEHNLPIMDYQVQLDKNKIGFKVVRKSDNVSV
jgi:lysosomal alpha-glucosidase